MNFDFESCTARPLLPLALPAPSFCDHPPELAKRRVITVRLERVAKLPLGRSQLAERQVRAGKRGAHDAAQAVRHRKGERETCQQRKRTLEPARRELGESGVVEGAQVRGDGGRRRRRDRSGKGRCHGSNESDHSRHSSQAAHGHGMSYCTRGYRPALLAQVVPKLRRCDISLSAEVADEQLPVRGDLDRVNDHDGRGAGGGVTGVLSSPSSHGRFMAGPTWTRPCAASARSGTACS